MVFATTFRSVFGGSHTGLLKQTHHHAHSTVADPNSVIAAKKCILSRLFFCPAAKDTATQQQTLSPTATSYDASLVPFHTHAGNTARATFRPHFLHQQQHVHGSSPAEFQRPLRVKFFRCKCPLLIAGLRRHSLACREGEQHAEEEDGDEAYQASGFSFQMGLGQMWPSILVHEVKLGQQMDDSNQLIVTSSSPVYQQLIQSLASLSPAAFANQPSLLSSSALLAASSTTLARDLPDEKNNDHIPLPSLSHTLQTVEECGDCYTGQLCPLTSQQHGRGVMQYANGESYAGEWEGGLQHGQGVMCYTDGRYSGEYVRGDRSGMGVWDGVDGNKYQGEWKAGLRNGKGKEWAGDELIYDGEWVANARHGYGMAQSAAGGWRYEGEWVNGVMDGYGSIEYSNGEMWEGQWHAGAMHGEGARFSSTGASQLETCQHGSLVTAQVQPASPGRQVSETMGAMDTTDDSTTGAGVEGAPNSRLELLSLLSQVATLQSALVDKLSRVEELLVQPPTSKQPAAMPTLMGTVSMAA